MLCGNMSEDDKVMGHGANVGFPPAWWGKPAPNSDTEYHVMYFANDKARLPNAYSVAIVSSEVEANEIVGKYLIGELSCTLYDKAGNNVETCDEPGHFEVSKMESCCYKGKSGKRMK